MEEMSKTRKELEKELKEVRRKIFEKETEYKTKFYIV